MTGAPRLIRQARPPATSACVAAGPGTSIPCSATWRAAAVGCPTQGPPLSGFGSWRRGPWIDTITFCSLAFYPLGSRGETPRRPSRDCAFENRDAWRPLCQRRANGLRSFASPAGRRLSRRKPDIRRTPVIEPCKTGPESCRTSCAAPFGFWRCHKTGRS